jgi:hypothetical protein
MQSFQARGPVLETKGRGGTQSLLRVQAAGSSAMIYDRIFAANNSTYCLLPPRPFEVRA